MAENKNESGGSSAAVCPPYWLVLRILKVYHPFEFDGPPESLKPNWTFICIRVDGSGWYLGKVDGHAKTVMDQNGCSFD